MSFHTLRFVLFMCLIAFTACSSGKVGQSTDLSGNDGDIDILPLPDDDIGEESPEAPVVDESINTDNSTSDDVATDVVDEDVSDNSTSDNLTSIPTLTTFFADNDSDGYGDAAVAQDAENQPVGYVLDNTDCDDADAETYPGAIEDLKDLIDQDCTGVAQFVLQQNSRFFEADGVTLKPSGPKLIITKNDSVTYDSVTRKIFVNGGKMCSRTFRDTDLVVTNILDDDGGCDGSYAKGSILDSVFDATGDLVQTRTVTTQEDQDADGNFIDDIGTGSHTLEDYVYTYTYHADGITPATRDGTRNGLPSAHVEFDENGEVISVDEDKEDVVTGLYDGVFDVHTDFVRDVNGFVVTKTKTDLVSGLVETTTNTNDGKGVPEEQIIVKEISAGVFDTTLVTIETTYLE